MILATISSWIAVRYARYFFLRYARYILDTFLIVVANEILTIFNTVKVLFDGL